MRVLDQGDCWPRIIRSDAQLSTFFELRKASASEPDRANRACAKVLGLPNIGVRARRFSRARPVEHCKVLERADRLQPKDRRSVLPLEAPKYRPRIAGSTSLGVNRDSMRS